ncbi:hypothetical protein JCM6882_003017 [Rhodosporidiobolus microsporus]
MDTTATLAPPAASTVKEEMDAPPVGGGTSGNLAAVKGGGAATPTTPTFFREMLEDLDDPIPTVQQLENFGLFDQSKSDRLLAEYRSTHPSPVSPSHFAPPSPLIVEPASRAPRRPSEPQHRHSLAVLPLETKYDASTPPSPLSPSASPRLNPFAFVRKATIRPRPSQRAKSASDVQSHPPQPTPALADVQPFFSSAKGAGAAVEEVSSPRGSFSLSRNETVKENRAPRKLRKAAAPKITVRTDDDFLLRPFAVPATEVEGQTSPPSSPNNNRPPAPIRLPSWRSSASSSNLATSPTSYSFSAASPSAEPRQPRRPSSPVGAFSASIRREGALPPVEARKRGSTNTTTSSTDDYLADNERAARFSPRASRGRFGSGSTPASPTASSSGGGVWGKLRLGASKKGSGGSGSSRPSSIASVDSASTWEVVDGADFLPPPQRTFEVLGRPERSLSSSSLSGGGEDQQQQQHEDGAGGPLSSPNLSRILEQPEFGTPCKGTKRSSIASSSSASRPSTSASLDSFAIASGATTPNGHGQGHGISASSSMTATRPGMPRSRPSSNLNLNTLSTAASFSSLRSHPPSPLAPLSSPPLSLGDKHSPPLSTAAAADPSASSTSLLSGSWPSSRSSRSRDSLFFSADGDEGEGDVYGDRDGDGDVETPASSAVEGDDSAVEGEEEEGARARVARRKRGEVGVLERLVHEEERAGMAGVAV